ncbi:MAG: DMT family transporter [Saprospiraceae bacterium]
MLSSLPPAADDEAAQRRYRLIGIGILLIGSLLFSCKGVLIKLAYLEGDVASISLLAIRMACALPFYLVIGYLGRGKKSGRVVFSTRDRLLAVVFGLCGYYLASYFDFLGLRYLSAGMERLVLYSYPTIVLLLGLFFLAKPIRPVQWIATAVCYVGIGIAFSGADFSGGSHFPLGAGLVFMGAFFYSIYLLGSGQLAVRVGSVRFTSLAMISAGTAVLLHAVISGAQLLGLPPAVYLYGATLGIPCTVLPSYLVTEGVRRLGAGDAAIIGGIGPVFTIILEYYVLGETLSTVQWIGGIIVIGAVLMIGRSRAQ